MTRLTTIALTGSTKFIIAVLLSGAGAWASSTFYVDCSQSTDYDGTAPSPGGGHGPWNSLTDPNGHTFDADDQLLFKRGTTCINSSTTCTGVSGTSCALQPEGGGTSGHPVVIDAYGTGPMPIIDGGTDTVAVNIQDSSNWTLQNLAVMHGTYYGVLVQALNTSSISGITLNNLDVSGAGPPSSSGCVHACRFPTDSAEVAVRVTASNPTGYTLSEINISGVIAHDSEVAEGIIVEAGDFTKPSGSKGTGVYVLNSSAYNIWGDGIRIEEVNTGEIQGSIVHDVGLCPLGDISTGPANSCPIGFSPNGIWTFNSSGVTIESNEAYNVQSWWLDGGGLDIDIWNTNVTLQYNYSHDNKAYCAAVLATGYCTSQSDNSTCVSPSPSTTNSIIRYNICSNNNRTTDSTNAGAVSGRNDIVLSSFPYNFTNNPQGGFGSLNGVQIYNNTSYWNPSATAQSTSPGTASELIAYPLSQATLFYTGSGALPNLYENNIVYAAPYVNGYPVAIDVFQGLVVDYNVYYAPSGSVTWYWDCDSTCSYSSSFSGYQSGTCSSGSCYDAHGYDQDPLLNNPTYDGAGMPIIGSSWMSTDAFTLSSTSSPAYHHGTQVCSSPGCTGTRDLFGSPLPSGSTGWDIGAHQY